MGKHIDTFKIKMMNENKDIDNNMKDLIIEALNKAFDVLKTRIPETKKIQKSSGSIIDVNPLDIAVFI